MCRDCGRGDHAHVGLSFLLAVTVLNVPFCKRKTDTIVVNVLILKMLTTCLFTSGLGRGVHVSTHAVGATLLYAVVVVIKCSSCTLVIVHSMTGAPVSRGSPRSVFALNRCLKHRRCKAHPLFCKPTCSSGITLSIRSNCYMPHRGDASAGCIHGRGASPSRGSSCIRLPKHIRCRCTRGVLFPHVCDSTRATCCGS